MRNYLFFFLNTITIIKPSWEMCTTEKEVKRVIFNPFYNLRNLLSLFEKRRFFLLVYDATPYSCNQYNIGRFRPMNSLGQRVAFNPPSRKGLRIDSRLNCEKGFFFVQKKGLFFLNDPTLSVPEKQLTPF